MPMTPDNRNRASVEQEWRESEARYRLALVAGRMGSWETDLVAGTRIWSEEGMALFGLALEGGIGHVGGEADEYAAAIHPEDRHLVPRLHALADAADSFPAAYRILHADGRTLWLEGRGLVVARQLDGRAHRLVSIVADVTDRKQAEAVLGIERERLALALDAGRMGVFDVRLADETIWWSRQMYRVFGVEPDEFVPSRESISALIHPHDREAFLQSRAAAIARRDSFVLEFRVVGSDGGVRWIRHRGLVEHDAEGRAVRSFGVAADITERKQAEQALRDADRNKDRFIATLAHELRNPLAPIRNALGVLRDEAAESERAAWCRGVIERQVSQMAHLLDDLLDVSRISGGRLQLRPARIAMADVIAHAVEIARPLVDAFGHTLTIDALPPEHRLHGDLTRLAQVFSNLLINAAKYTPAGGRIGVHFRVEGPMLETTVADTGIGIAAELLPEVFDLFGRARASPLEQPESGLGLGLSLARSLVEMHGGCIDARSAGPGSGSEFVVRLPLASAVIPTPAAVDSAAPATGSRRWRVLVADDLRDNADSLAILIESMGHEVHVAYDGAAALQVAESVQPDVALLDLGMPEMNGYEACRRIRSTAWGAHMTLIAQTGWGRDDDRARTREAGFDHHIVKPVDLAELEALLQSLSPQLA